MTPTFDWEPEIDHCPRCRCPMMTATDSAMLRPTGVVDRYYLCRPCRRYYLIRRAKDQPGKRVVCAETHAVSKKGKPRRPPEVK